MWPVEAGAFSVTANSRKQKVDFAKSISQIPGMPVPWPDSQCIALPCAELSCDAVTPDCDACSYTPGVKVLCYVLSICTFDWAQSLQVRIYYSLSAMQFIVCAVG